MGRYYSLTLEQNDVPESAHGWSGGLSLGRDCNRARALAPWVLLVLVFGGHFVETGVVRRLLEGWVSPRLEFNTYPFPFGIRLG